MFIFEKPESPENFGFSGSDLYKLKDALAVEYYLDQEVHLAFRLTKSLKIRFMKYCYAQFIKYNHSLTYMVD